MILLLSAHDSLPALVSDTLEDQGYLGRLLDTLRERKRERDYEDIRQTTDLDLISLLVVTLSTAEVSVKGPHRPWIS